MKNPDPDHFGDILRSRLEKSQRIAIVGVGDVLSPFDRPGMHAASEIGKLKLQNVRVFLAGTNPESITSTLRAYHPDHVIFLDAADMGAVPGSTRVIEPGNTQANLVSSHVLPLPVVMEFIAKDMECPVTLIGIQPDLRQPGRDLSREESGFLDRNLSVLVEILRAQR